MLLIYRLLFLSQIFARINTVSIMDVTNIAPSKLPILCIKIWVKRPAFDVESLAYK